MGFRPLLFRSNNHTTDNPLPLILSSSVGWAVCFASFTSCRPGSPIGLLSLFFPAVLSRSISNQSINHFCITLVPPVSNNCVLRVRSLRCPRLVCLGCALSAGPSSPLVCWSVFSSGLLIHSLFAFRVLQIETAQVDRLL